MNTELFKKKSKVFYDNKLPVHIVLKTRSFHNGPITEVSADFFMLRDKVLGEMPVFFEEIYSIEPLYKGDELDIPIFQPANELDETLTGVNQLAHRYKEESEALGKKRKNGEQNI